MVHDYSLSAADMVASDGGGGGGGGGMGTFVLTIRGVTDNTNASGAFSITSPNKVDSFRNYSNASTNFIIVPIGTRLCIRSIKISGAPATGSALLTVTVQVTDNANNVSPTFSDVASYQITTSVSSPVPFTTIPTNIVIEPKATLNDNNALSLTAVRFFWNQSTVFTAYIEVTAELVW